MHTIGAGVHLLQRREETWRCTGSHLRLASALLMPQALVQEHGLEWAREMRGGTGCELILSAASHIALMQHNYSNVSK